MIKIPKMLHWFWAGPPMPGEYQQFIRTWRAKHPDWEARVWTPENLPPLRFQKFFDEAATPCFQSELVRYEMVYKLGGIYLDTDFECYKNIEPLIRNLDAFSAWQYVDHNKPGAIACGFFGAQPSHPWLKEVLDNIPMAWDPELDVIGPPFFTRMTKGRQDVTILPKKHFYPYNSWEKGKRNNPFPEAYASHHWAGSWVEAHQEVLRKRGLKV